MHDPTIATYQTRSHQNELVSFAHAPTWIQKFPSPILASSSEASERLTPLLAGLSFAVKDNIDVAGIATTAACPAYAKVAIEHAQVVKRLLQAGAALRGKTNLDQFACGLNGTRSPWGAPRNCFDARYISGGSSSGSAIAVASGEVDFALGTDTAGSGRVPAGLNNIVGFKPSRGLISTRGVLPASQSVDCVSIFARNVPMALKVLEAAVAYDPIDAFSRRLPLKSGTLPKHFKFGLPRASQLEFFGDELASAEFAQAVNRLIERGGCLVEVDYAPFQEAAATLYESAYSAERYTAIREFFDEHADQLDPSVRAILAKSTGYSAADLFSVQTRLAEISHVAAAMWREFDVFLVPTAPTVYTIEAMQADPINLNRNLGYYTNFVNLLDMAAISVPASFRSDGLPFGVTFIGPAGSDWQLAQLAHGFHCGAVDARALPMQLSEADHVPNLSGDAASSQLSPPHSLLKETVALAVVGAHLSGMPLNGQLTERGAWLERKVSSSKHYRLYALPGTVPAKPGMVRTLSNDGVAIDMEVWRMPVEAYGSFVALIPSPLGIGTIELADGSSVQGFVCEQWATLSAADVSHFGGWRAYVASLNKA